MQNLALQSLRAIRQERFLTVDDSRFSCVTHHIADAVVELARQVYPDAPADEQE
jgi:hypothetical protein